MDALGSSPIVVAFGLALAGLVATIAFFDLRHLIIPDGFNLALAGGGFAFQYWKAAQPPLTAIGFAIVVALLFLALRQVFMRLRGQAGLGLGDVKMAGASALWFSPWNLALYLLVTCVSALIFVAFRHVGGSRHGLETKVPFGPFLGLGVFATWVCENSGLPTFIPEGAV